MNENSPDPVNPYLPPSSDVDGAVWPEQNDSDSQMLADRGSRFGGALIDNLLYIAAAAPGGIMIFYNLRELGNMMIGVALILVLLLPLAIYQWYLISTTGQSLAKKWLRMRIVKMDGSRVDFVSGVLLRIWVPGLIAGAIGFVTGAAGAGDSLSRIFNLVDALFIFGAGSRCLHDYIAGTKVVRA